MKLKGLALLALTAVLSQTGCTVEADTPVGPYSGGPYGDIVLTWSINGDTSGSSCATHSAAQIQVEITDINGVLVDTWTLACSVEGTDEYLPAGAYTASAQLLDVNGNAITTTASATVTINADLSSAPLDFDFPSSSFTN